MWIMFSSHSSPLAEVGNSLNWRNLNTTSGSAYDRDLRGDDSGFFNSVSLMVFTPSRKVYEEIVEAFVAAGLPRHATNFYPLSAQEVRLHDRRRTVQYDYPDLIAIISRISYFDNRTQGIAWASQFQPAFFLRSPSHSEEYFISVPEPMMTNDVTGDSEAYLEDTIDQLLQAIIDQKTANGKAELVRHEQLAAVPNDKAVRLACLNNASFIAAVDPVMVTGGCGFGTRDCRYGTSPAIDLPFGDDLFFVVVGVKHEAIKHASYASVMFTSQLGYEQSDHTITFRETQGSGAPEMYLPGVPEASNLYSVTLSRQCPEDDIYCIPFTYDQFKADDLVYWMERAYLQWSTGVAPSIEEYIMSHVLVFRSTTN